MNRAYALNRDKLKCRVCGGWLISGTPYAHRINPNLPLNKVNRVNNLVSLHKKCFMAVNDPNYDINQFDVKAQNKIIGYREKLVISHMVIEPFLEIKSSFFDANSNGGGLRNGWVQFRDFANILFAIAFAVIIFAQATGIGISNYNIKKILTRLIMVAVLVNISFILCQIAVDISNILGSSLQKLFADMAGRVGVPSGSGLDAMVDSITGEQVTWFSLGGIVYTIMTVILGGAGAIALVVTWEICLIPFLLAILGCLLGVLFFFIILGIRQAGVLLLIALAPIAIVCYALPNTKSIFDKWLKMFEGLLLVYPICGILIGGGQFASALLISAGGGTNFFYDLVAMLVSVVPFFLVPSILKSSMAAMGNLGLRVSQFGQNLGHRMNAGIRNSEWGVTHSAD